MKEYMKNVGVKDAIEAGHTETICWDCKNACRGGCSWSNPKHQEPVNGWVAEETKNGYRVITCPRFERETYGGARYRTADDYILALETKVTVQEKQIKNLKNTLWWKYVNKLRSDNLELRKQILLLNKKIEEYEIGGTENE